MATDAPEVTTLEDRIDRLEHELAALRTQYETALTGWPNEPTQAQGFLGHRWQRRNGDGYQEPLFNIPEAPADQYYYGRHQFGWAQVVEEAPEVTARLSVTGWARASFGADVPWIALDDVLANYVPDAPVNGQVYGRIDANWINLGSLGYATIHSPQFTGTPTAPTPPDGDASSRLATTQFVADNAGSGGIPDVSAGYGAFARVRLGSPDRTEWIDFNELRVAGLDSPQFAGVPTAPMPGAGANSTQLSTTEWVQNQFVTRDYLPRYGGQMTGTLITASGSGVSDVGLGVGDATSGFYRVGGALAFINGSAIAMQFLGDRTTMMTQPVSMALQRIMQMADPTQAGDATNKRYVDAAVATATTPTVLRTDVYEPNEVSIASPSGPMQFLDVNFSVPPLGLRYLLVTVDPLFSVATNPTNPAYSLYYQCSLSPPGVEVPVLVYSWRAQGGGSDTDFWRAPAKFRVAIDASPGTVRVQVYVRCATSGNPNLIQLGANSNMRSLVSIQDLGPIQIADTPEQTGGSDAEETEPSRTGRSQRRTARPHNRRAA